MAVVVPVPNKPLFGVGCVGCGPCLLAACDCPTSPKRPGDFCAFLSASEVVPCVEFRLNPNAWFDGLVFEGAEKRVPADAEVGLGSDFVD